MAEKDNNSTNINSPLLSDEEFAFLMEEEFDKQGSGDNDLDKQKVWNVLEAKISHESATDSVEKKQSNRTTSTITNLLSLAAAAVLVIALMPLLMTYHAPTKDRIKGVYDFPLINISAFTVEENGELQSAMSDEPVGTMLVFKVDTPQAYMVVLAMSKGNEMPTVRYEAGQLQPGIGQLLQKQGKVYGYELDSGDKNLKFCAISAKNPRVMDQRLRLLTRIWPNLPKASCVMINAI